MPNRHRSQNYGVKNRVFLVVFVFIKNKHTTTTTDSLLTTKTEKNARSRK